LKAVSAALSPPLSPAYSCLLSIFLLCHLILAYKSILLYAFFMSFTAHLHPTPPHPFLVSGLCPIFSFRNLPPSSLIRMNSTLTISFLLQKVAEVRAQRERKLVREEMERADRKKWV
jgi:hypothetical protein